MRQGYRMVGLALAACGSLLVASAQAAGRVELVLVTDRDAPLTAQQTWVRELGQAGIRNVRLHRQRSTDRVEIEVRGTKDSPLYVVHGTLDSRGDIVLPGGRYRRGQAHRVATWLDELARRGPPESREPVVAFGLPRSQMAAARDDLTPAVEFSTKDVARAEVVRRIVRRLQLPVRMDEKLLAEATDRVAEELKGLSRGTVLAYVLRPAGLVLVPRMSDAAGPEYLITTSRGQREIWPIGWTPEKRRQDLVPKMFEFLTINLDNVPVAQALDAIGKRLEIPVLVDHSALARHGIDPEEKRATVPRGRTTYSLVLNKALFQAKLKSELRVDEARQPFLWVTTIKPIR
ncbi:MAG: hypothetical protein JW888_06000 [Pirellulales bacterium]|nr:hypothetical protein [Pirellulales bacterium]